MNGYYYYGARGIGTITLGERVSMSGGTTGSGEGPEFGYTPTIGEDGKHLV